MSAGVSIFISHPHKDERLAKELRSVISDVFGKTVSVFVSSEIANLPAGATWREELKTQLSSSNLLIVLCSPDTVKKNWLHFEVGGAWVLDLPVIPVCHSGMATTELPEQFRGFNALEMSDSQFGSKFIESIGTHIDLHVAPLINFDEVTARAQEAIRDRQTHEFDLFVSCPMSSLSPQEYETMLPVIRALCDDLVESKLATRIYFSGYDKTKPEDFDHPYFGSRTDFAALEESDRFILIYPGRCASGCLVEAGFAISQRIPSVYFLRDALDLPYNLQSADMSHGVMKQTYEDETEIRSIIMKHWDQLFPAIPATP